MSLLLHGNACLFTYIDWLLPLSSQCLGTKIFTHHKRCTNFNFMNPYPSLSLSSCCWMLKSVFFIFINDYLNGCSFWEPNIVGVIFKLGKGCCCCWESTVGSPYQCHQFTSTVGTHPNDFSVHKNVALRNAHNISLLYFISVHWFDLRLWFLFAVIQFSYTFSLHLSQCFCFSFVLCSASFMSLQFGNTQVWSILLKSGKKLFVPLTDIWTVHCRGV